MRYTDYITDDVKMIVETAQKEQTPESQKNLFHGLMIMQENFAIQKKEEIKKLITNYLASRVDMRGFRLDIKIIGNMNGFVFNIVKGEISYKCFRVSYMAIDHWDIEQFERTLVFTKSPDHLFLSLHLLTAIIESLENTGFMGFTKDFYEILISHSANAKFYQNTLENIVLNDEAENAINE